MQHTTREATDPEARQPFLVRHLFLILTLLFLAAFREPLAVGLEPQITYLSSLFKADEPEVIATPPSMKIEALPSLQPSVPRLLDV